MLQPAGELCNKARDAGLIVITAGKGDVVRLVPPLIVTDQDIEKCCKILGEIIVFGDSKKAKVQAGVCVGGKLAILWFPWFMI